MRGFSERAFRSAGSALPCSASLAHAAAGRLFVEQLEVHWGATSETPGRHSDVAFSALGQVGEFAWCAAIKVRKRTTLLIVIAAAFSSRSPRYTLIPEDPGFTAREADLQVKAVPVREHARFLCLGDAHRRQPI